MLSNGILVVIGGFVVSVNMRAAQCSILGAPRVSLSPLRLKLGISVLATGYVHFSA